jgi:hypothetical protein
MRSLVIGTLLVGLAAPAALAQQSARTGAVAESGQTAAGTYQVFFGFDKATLTSSARQVVGEAAQDFQRTGAATISVSGHADTVGRASYNEELSRRRAEAVQAELVQNGVPRSAIAMVAEGQNNLLVPTGNGVPEPRNRRVQIVVPQPPAPAPVAQAPVVTPEPMAHEEPAKAPNRFAFSLSPVYGHNFRESDNHTSSDLAGAQLTFNALPELWGGVSLKQSILWAFNAQDDGLAGRTVASVDFHPNLGIVSPTFSINFGGIYGRGVQDGFVVGPEISLAFNLPGGFTLRPTVAYDYQLRNRALDQGILWGGLDLGLRF